MTIVGSGFSSGPPNPTPVCRFGQVTSPAVIIGDAEMRCASPRQSSPGSVPVLVALNGNDFTPLRKHLFAYAPSTTGVLSSSPTIIPTGGGTKVRATPSYSSTTSSSSTSLFPISYWSTCLLSRADVNASSPASSAYPQDGADCVSPPLGGEGEWTLSLSQNTQHKSNGAPTARVTAYNSTVATLALPSMALTPGGTPVTVSASNFGRFPQYDPWCKFGRRRMRGTLVTTGNGGKAICRTPPAPHPLESTVPLSVSIDGGTSFSQTAINFVYHRLPVIQSASPSIGIFTGGTVVQISASNLLDSSTAKCRFVTIKTHPPLPPPPPFRLHLSILPPLPPPFSRLPPLHHLFPLPSPPASSPRKKPQNSCDTNGTRPLSTTSKKIAHNTRRASGSARTSSPSTQLSSHPA